jgi:flagellar protein FliS
MSNPYSQYQQTTVETATPTRLVVMLYDGAIRFLCQALPAMQARQLDQQSHLIGKAQAIIMHLRATLDMEAGGKVAGTLETFYVITYDALTDANIYDKPERVKEVIHALRELREAWIEVDRQCQVTKGNTLAGQARPAADGLPKQLAAA